MKGVMDYKSDKRDAKASVGALDRCIAKFNHFLTEFNEQRIKRFLKTEDQITYTVEPKYDGFAIELSYKNGILEVKLKRREKQESKKRIKVD